MRAFHQIYNPAMALRVLARVRRELPEATLTMAGQDNGLQDEMQCLAAELGLQGAVRFPGFLKMKDKIREAEHADIFINTPRIDNRPVCVVEACAMGLAVVSTNVGGVPDLVTHEKTALLVPDDDVEAMARSVFRLVEDAALSSTLSQNGRELAKASAPENVCPKWEKLFTEVLAERNGSMVGRS
jgi:glycosyltransferase involved in cell wall biosynthesis